MKRLIICLCVFWLGHVAVAQEGGVSSTFIPSPGRDLTNPTGLWPMFGLGLGYLDQNGGDHNEGLPLQVKLLGSYYFPEQPWVADLGFGLQNEFVTEKGSGSNSIVTMQLEAAGRYKLIDNWQVGGLWNSYFNGSNSYESNTKNVASFIGAQALRQFTHNEYLMRAGARFMTDIGLRGAQANVIMFELHISFGEGQTAPSPAPVVVQPAEPTPVATHLTDEAMRTYTITPMPVHFKHGQTRMVGSANRYMDRLAKALANNRHLFTKVEIVGHADRTGTDNYNWRLSERRAKTIADKIVGAGLNRSQVKAVARGESEPFATGGTEASLLLNRRVEFKFRGVNNQDALARVIDSAGN